MATATLPRRGTRRRHADNTAGMAVAGAAAAVIVTLALAAGHVAGPGVPAVGATAFLLLVAWCASHRRVDRALAGLGLYLGLLDGYVKLRTGSPVVTLGRDVLVAAIAGGVLLRALRSQQRLALPPLGGLVAAFGAIVFVELFNPSAEGGIASKVAGVRQHLEFVPLFFLGYAFVRRERQVQTLLLILVVCASAGGVVSLIQSQLTPAELAEWGPGYSERILGTGAFEGAPRVAFDDAGNTSVRPFGLGSDMGGGAVAAALALPALVALMMGASGWVRLATIPLSLGIALAIATSGTRAALITVFASALAFGVLVVASRNTMRIAAGLAVASAVVYVVFASADNNTTERAKSITPTKVISTFNEERATSVAKFADYAVQYPLGVGVGSVGPAGAAFGAKKELAERFNIETEWNFLVLEVGLAGLAVFLALNLRLMFLALTRIRHIADPALRVNLAALAAPLFGLIVADFAGPTTASVPPAPYLWLVAGVLSFWLVTAYRRERPGLGPERRQHLSGDHRPVESLKV